MGFGGTVMPPSASVRRIKADWELGKNKDGKDAVSYHVHIQWRKHMPWLVRQIPKERITHRSRDLSLSSKVLQAEELRHKVEVARAAAPSLAKIALTPRLSEQVLQDVLGPVLKMLAYSPPYKEHYINDHATSSLGGGFLWPSARSVTDAEWVDYISRVKESLTEVLNHPGWGNATVWNTGIRARTNQLPGFVDSVANEETRSRIISFEASASAYSVGLAQKRELYRQIFENVLKTLQPAGDLIFPMAEGYKAYLTAAELFRDRPFKAYDGVSWESLVGTILGPAFRALLIQLDGFYMVPSGIVLTSILDTVAMTRAIAAIRGKFILLGDDCSSWNEADLATPYLEYQPMDTKLKIFLGYSYLDPDRPSISGIKATSESSQLKERAELGLDTTFWPGNDVGEGADKGWMPGRHTPQEIVTNAGLYVGRIKDGTTLDVFKRMEGEVQAPWLTTEHVVRDATRGRGNVFAWAEEMGVEDLFTEA